MNNQVKPTNFEELFIDTEKVLENMAELSSDYTWTHTRTAPSYFSDMSEIDEMKESIFISTEDIDIHNDLSHEYELSFAGDSQCATPARPTEDDSKKEELAEDLELFEKCFKDSEKDLSRWSYKQDRQLFTELKKACEYYFVNYEYFLTMDYETMLEQEAIIDMAYNSLKGSWKKCKAKFISRIFRLCQNQKFTVREKSKIKICLKKRLYHNNEFFRKLQSYFPGKTLESTIQACKRQD